MRLDLRKAAQDPSCPASYVTECLHRAAVNTTPDFFPMPTDWRMRYDSALGERDPAKVSDACDLARRAINDRVLELANLVSTDPQRQELEEALREILIHELRVLRGDKG